MSKIPMEIHQTAQDFQEIALEIRVTCHLYCLLVFLLLSSSWTCMCYQVKIENKQKKRNFGFRQANTRLRFLSLSFFYFLFYPVESYPSWIFLLTNYYTFFPLFKRNISFEIKKLYFFNNFMNSKSVE